MKKIFIVVVLAAFAVCAVALAQQRKAVDEARFGSVEVMRTESHVMRPARTLVIPWHVNYQGYLTDDAGNPINDTLSMRFSIWDAASVGTELWNETQNTTVEDGIFNVILGSITPISSDAFRTGESRWLELEVETQTLSPRTEITSVGYAYRALNADTADFALNAAADNDWAITGNVLHPSAGYGLAMRSSNMLYGVYDSSHVNLGISCTTGTSGQNWGFCTVSGGLANVAARENATVGGGWNNTAGSMYATVSGGQQNTAGNPWATVGGGQGNTASQPWTAVGGGQNNTASGSRAVVAGGSNNSAAASYATVGGGYADSAVAARATVGGGDHNIASGEYATVAGGGQNTASGLYATVGGGRADTAAAPYAGVLSGYGNVAGDATTDTAAVVAGGWDNAATDRYTFVGGGYQNTANGWSATVGGGWGNSASATRATVSGGWDNTASDSYATVGGGGRNSADGLYATVAGGYSDTSAGDYSFTAGAYSVAANYNSVAFNGQATTASGQTRVGALSKASGTFTIDHPLEPMRKILNHYFVESPEMVLIYRGVTHIGGDGRAEVHLPDYFDALNRNPMVQLTGVGTSDVFVAEEVSANHFVIGGKPGTKVYWTVTGDRKDQSAEITRIIMPVEQPKEGDLAGRSLDDDFLATTKAQLEQMGQAGQFQFRTQRGRQQYEQSQRALLENR